MGDEFTPEVLERIFRAAVSEGDARGVEAALTLLAARDPRRAQRLYDTLELGLALAMATDLTTEPNGGTR